MPNIKIKNKYDLFITYENINSVFVPNEDITKLSFYGLEGAEVPTYDWTVIAPPFPNPILVEDALLNWGFDTISQVEDILNII